MTSSLAALRFFGGVPAASIVRRGQLVAALRRPER